MTSALLILGGLVLLAIGGELLVRGAVGVAYRLNISPLLAGLTIVGFGPARFKAALQSQGRLASVDLECHAVGTDLPDQHSRR